MYNLSVIIPVFNGIEYTKRCIATLQDAVKNADSEMFKTSFVVVDDGSSDGTSDWILKSKIPDVFLQRGDGTLWWSGGVNVGVKYALETLNAQYILLWNNDVFPDKNYFKELFKAILLHKESILGSKIYCDSQMKIIWSMGGIFNPKSGKKYMLGYKKADNESYNKPIKADWLPGMGTLIPASVIGATGYWDQHNFPQYHGDSDFTYRAKLKGYNIEVMPQLKMWNDITNTGIKHNLDARALLKMLYDIKSNLNVKKNFLFYRKYATSVFAYHVLFVNYFKLFGGFIKWKMLSVIGKKRKY